MKPFLTTIISLYTFFFAKIVLAESTDPLSRLKRAGEITGLTDATTDPQRIAANIIFYILGFVGVLFLASTIFAGWQWMISGGNEENISKAKKRLTNSIIGIVVITAAYSITVFVSNSIYQATCTYDAQGNYYCPPAIPQSTGGCGNDLDCENIFGSDNWACNYYGSCINNFCNGSINRESLEEFLIATYGYLEPDLLEFSDSDIYCMATFTPEHQCDDNRCRQP